MRYPSPLVAGVLRRRFLRFIAEVELEDGEVVEAHVPNSGAMTGCSTPGSPCFISPAGGPHRRLAWTLEQVIDGAVTVGVNTARANALALEALESGGLRLPGLHAPFTARREVSTGDGSRLDWRLEDALGWYWVEVKNITWVETGIALFPDARTARGTRHLGTLTRLRRGGDRAALVYVVQRGDAGSVAAAAELDPDYAEALQEAVAAGVAVAAVRVHVTPEALTPVLEIPVALGLPPPDLDGRLGGGA